MVQAVVAIDAMGGDEGPAVTVPALAETLILHPKARFLLFGRQEEIEECLGKYAHLRDAVEVVHCDVAVSMNDKPSVALRQGRKVSSMWQAIQAVKDGRAHACLSAGNTGALMAMSKIILRTHEGIERPAIAGIWPTLIGECVVLDVGANIGGTVAQYVQFAAMGAAYARTIFGLQNPRVGLLNIGVEEVKGTDAVRDAAELLERSPLNFIGFVEGDGIGRGDADVVVTDGFTGNIALKTGEGTARQMSTYMRQAFGSSLMSRIGYVFAAGALAALRQRMDPNTVNGGMFLGLNGIVVKSHGGVDCAGFGTATQVAIEVAEADISKIIASDIARMQKLLNEI